MGWFFAGMLTAVVIGKLMWRRRWRARRSGGSWYLPRFLRRIDASPDQEAAIRAVMDDVYGAAREMKADVGGTRHHVAGAMRDERFDAVGVEQRLSPEETGLDRLRTTLVDGLGRIHEVLRPEQRQQVAVLLERGPRRLSRRAC